MTTMVATKEYGVSEPISAIWDPEYQLGALKDRKTPWGREDYEAVCAAAAITPRSDEEIKASAYAYQYAEFGDAQWTGMGRDGRVGFVLAERRYAGVAAEQAAYKAAHPAPKVRVTVSIPMED